MEIATCEENYLSYYCSKCHAHYLIDKVIREDAEFTAYLKCPYSTWYHKHPELIAYSHNEGDTWSLSRRVGSGRWGGIQAYWGDSGSFLIPQEFKAELLKMCVISKEEAQDELS